MDHEDQKTAPETEQQGYAPETHAEPYTYWDSGSGKKESPFANSPYVMDHEPRERHGGSYEKPRKPKVKKKGGFWKKTLAVAAVLALLAGSCGITAAVVDHSWREWAEEYASGTSQKIQALQEQINALSSANTGNSVSGSPVAHEGGLTPSQVYAQNVRSVVLITCEVTGSVYGQTTTGTSSGSGFILTEDGYVITNCHVVEGATKVNVTTYDGEKYAATVCGSDQTNDVAVLKVEAAGLPAAIVGSSDALIVGDQVVAIGNPLGDLTSTMTVGYISAKDRDVTTDGTTINMLQTDAAINSGNSGGPLFNMKGEVVGITTAKYSGNSSSGATIEGIGFAIPIDDAMALVGDLMEFGYVKGAYMGVTISDMDPQTAAMAEVYGLPVGPIIVTVEEGGAAIKAGMQPNDIVTKLGDARIETVSDLTRKLRSFEPGDTTTITVFRGGNQLELEITFGERPADAGVTQQPQQVPQETVPEEYYSGDGSIEEWLNPFFGWGFD